jgi:hypothetical protein
MRWDVISHVDGGDEMQSVIPHSTMCKPPITLLSTTDDVPTVRCGYTEKRCRRRFKATYEPALCAFHRDRADPQDGWAFISRKEARLLNILRERGWTDGALQDVLSLNTESPLSVSPASSMSSLNDRAASLTLDIPLSLIDLDDSGADLPSPGTPTE